jgi:hypothetical protein
MTPDRKPHWLTPDGWVEMQAAMRDLAGAIDRFRELVISSGAWGELLDGMTRFTDRLTELADAHRSGTDGQVDPMAMCQCGHVNLVHDVENMGDSGRMCCFDSCDCGKPSGTPFTVLDPPMRVKGSDQS